MAGALWLIQKAKGKNLPKKTQLWYHKPMMEKPGPESKLHSFFHDVIRQSFRQLGIYDSTVTRYMALTKSNNKKVLAI